MILEQQSKVSLFFMEGCFQEKRRKRKRHPSETNAISGEKEGVGGAYQDLLLPFFWRKK